ncbi:MAG: EAL domain-containing protein [Rhodocyclaceae bacterium]|nr:EAL domain-containing protein [Rhodocyclaceae bacterium]
MKLELWQDVINSSLEAIWIVNALTLRVICANHAAGELIGTAPECFANLPIGDLAATPEDLFFWEDVAAGLTKEIRSETLMLHKDGHTVPVERRVSHVRLSDCESIYILAVQNRSEQRRIETELETLIAELRATLESTADGILVVDLNGGIRSYNQRFSDMWALPEQLLCERDDAAVFSWMAKHAINAESYATRLAAIASTPLLECSDTLVLRSGRVLERVTLPQYARGRPIGRVYSFRDITERLADEAHRHLAAKVFEASLDAIFVTAPDFTLIAANPSCHRMTGLTAENLVGRKAHEIVFDHDREAFVHTLVERMQSDGHWQDDVWHLTANGVNAPCSVTMVRVTDETGTVTNYVGVFKDISETLAAKQRIEELAYNDPLTGLPNRLLLAERIDHALRTSSRDRTPFAVMFIDLDRFKQINDSLGHQFGDRVLLEVASRLNECVRTVDTVARLGGDEFVLLLHGADARGSEITARRVLDSLSQPCQLDEMSFTVTCSIGVALYPEDGETMDDLIKNADSAMYHVKDRGRSDFRFYQPQMNIDLLARMKLDHAMRGALARGGFRLAYQPQVDLSTGRIYGAEALLRWRDPDLGEISPAHFIPIAEETGIIVGIGDWVLRESVRQAAQWRAEGLDLAIAVNVSALQFRQADFAERVAEVLAEFDYPAGYLELELTESILINDADAVLSRLQQLAHLGLKLSIDDFGTGYSSLAYLKRFPLHRLKIDRSFVDDLPENESDAAIVTAIINLARVMQFRVIAEGVENAEQREFLCTAGCHEYQGYLCSPAVTANDFVTLVKRLNEGGEAR